VAAADSDRFAEPLRRWDVRLKRLALPRDGNLSDLVRITRAEAVFLGTRWSDFDPAKRTRSESRLRAGHRPARRGIHRWPTGSGPREVTCRAVRGFRCWPDLLRALAFVSQPRPFLPADVKAPEDTSPVLGFADPVDLRVAPDDRVLRIYEDDLEILVHPVLADPIRVEDL